MRALVIDDAKSMRMIIGRMLSKLGFAVTEAADGAEGLKQLHSMSRVDLVLVDCNMPVMDGFAFVLAVRADAAYQDLRLMMVTAEEDQTLADRAMQAGANEYLVKPFTHEGIRAKLQRLGLCPLLSA